MWNPFKKAADSAALAPAPAPAPVAPAPASSKVATDNLVNFVMGMGTPNDRTQHTSYTLDKFVDRMTADAIYGSSWLGKRCVTVIADDMVSMWRQHLWDGSQDDTKGIFGLQQEERRLQVRKRVHTGLKWGRQFGGAIVVMMTKDAKYREVLAEPLDYTKIKKGDLVNLIPYDRWRIYGQPPMSRATSDRPDLFVPYLNQSLDDQNFGLPEHYYIAETGLAIHHTRCIRFDGDELSWYEWSRNGMWHDSVYRSLLRALTSYDTLMSGATNLVTQANVDVLSAQGFADAIATAEGTANMQQRYQLMNTMKSLYGMMVLDKDLEEFNRMPVGALAGMTELCTRFALDVSGAAGVPLTRLFGQPLMGLGTNGEGDQVNHEKHVAARQESNLTPQMDQLDEVLVRSALGRMPEDYHSKWNPLRKLTEEQQAAIDKVRSDAQAARVDRKIVTREACAREIRASGSMPNFTEADVQAAAKADKEAAAQAAAPLPNGKPMGAGGFAGRGEEKLPA